MQLSIVMKPFYIDTFNLVGKINGKVGLLYPCNQSIDKTLIISQPFSFHNFFPCFFIIFLYTVFYITSHF